MLNVEQQVKTILNNRLLNVEQRVETILNYHEPDAERSAAGQINHIKPLTTHDVDIVFFYCRLLRIHYLY